MRTSSMRKAQAPSPAPISTRCPCSSASWLCIAAMSCDIWDSMWACPTSKFRRVRSISAVKHMNALVSSEKMMRNGAKISDIPGEKLVMSVQRHCQ
eukprot:scaffold83865_cov52-Prasinocladus_malaysianus.AAC.1